MNCKICESPLGPKAKQICGNCNNKKHDIECIECKKTSNVTAHYFITLDVNTHKCKQCKLKGDGNPNFGKKWSPELKDKVSKIIKSKVNDKYRLDCAKGMKGKVVSAETKLKRKNTNDVKTLNGYVKPKQSNETKLLIGIKSKLKFTEEYFINQRKRNEENGIWIPLDVKDDYLLYRELANWKGNILSENIVGTHLLKTGKLKSKENNGANSLVRDHMYGRKAGFNDGVFPEILRHPANCQIITHSNNVKKAKFNNDSIISLDDLFYKILNWNTKYDEHTICLDLIKKYKKGIRYNKQQYINNYYE